MKLSILGKRGAVPVALLAALTLTALAGCTTAAPEETAEPADFSSIDPIVIRYSDYLPEASDFGTMSLAFQEAVTERTDGKVTFENYWAGSLLAFPEQLSGVRDGIADMALIHGGNFPSELPIAAWLQALGLDLTGSPLHDIAAGSAVIQELVQTYEPLIAEYEANGIKPLYYTSTVPFMMACTEPLEDGAESLDGRNVRSGGTFQSGATEAMGGVPVTLAFGEVYEGLQRGVLGCVLSPPGSIQAFSFAEVAPEFVPVSVISGLTGYSMNLDFWDSLPPIVQDVIFEEAARASIGYGEIETGSAAAFGDTLASGDANFNDVSGLLPVLQEYQEDTLAELPSAAPAGVDDAEEIVAWAIERKAYWTDVLVELGFPLVGSEEEELLEFFQTADDIDLEPFWERFREEVVAPGLAE